MVYRHINYLGQESSSDEDLHQHCDDQLDDKEDDGSWTFFSNATETIANSCLGFQGKEECPRQSLHLHHTRCVVWWRVKIWRNMMQQKLTVINLMIFYHKRTYEHYIQHKHVLHTSNKISSCYFESWKKTVFLSKAHLKASVKWWTNASHQAGPHAPTLSDTIALQIRTRFLQRWLWIWRTCSAIACPQMLSKGHACTKYSTRWHVQSAHCFCHLWREYASSSSKSQQIYQHPVRALKHPSVSGSGKPSVEGSYAMEKMWLMSSGK